jgi:hypothetical protein
MAIGRKTLRGNVKSIFYLASILVLAACESAPAPSAPATTTAAQNEPVQKVGEPVVEPTDPTAAPEGMELRIFEILDFDGKAPADLKIQGEIQGGLHWKDNSGENLIVFDRHELGGVLKDTGERFLTTTMTAHHVISSKGVWTSVRDYKEVVDSCEFDTRADLKVDPKAWSLTDIDQDGIMEATWVWYSTCTSDVSPATKKVMMTIGDKKYPLRGNTKVDAGGGDIMGGDFKVDPAFGDLEAEFLEHAKKVWKESGN